MPDFEHIDLRKQPRFVALRANFEDALEELYYTFYWNGLDPDAAMDQVAGRFERIIQSASGPVFDEEGYIWPIQTCTEGEVRRWFGFNNCRVELFEKICNWIGLARAVKAKRLLLDGSFVTAKDEPGDVDAVVLLPEDFRDQLRDGNLEAGELDRMVCTGEPRELFAVEEEDWWEWFVFFSRTREASGRRKGLIEVTL